MVNSLKEVCSESNLDIWRIANKAKPNERKDSPNITTVNLKVDEDDYNPEDNNITDNAVFVIPNLL
jgi:hypothetical protein